MCDALSCSLVLSDFLWREAEKKYLLLSIFLHGFGNALVVLIAQEGCAFYVEMALSVYTILVFTGIVVAKGNNSYEN